MIAPLGEYALAAALLVAAISFLAALTAWRRSGERLLRAASAGVTLTALLFALAAGLLLTALVRDHFEIAYVAQYSESSMPFAYKIAAMWGGQAGSLLLWALLVGAVSALGARVAVGGPMAQRAAATATLAGVCAFFAATLVFAANPFAVFEGYTPAGGQGLNPMLQNPAMAAHPPLLFLGYAGFTAPFAALVGALVSGRTDNRWLAPARRWILVSWISLTAGIALGAWWAYVELGWGGYWAWDPVENASLLPWLTSTALLHSLIAQQRRGSFKRFNASLIAATFVLCAFGTYLTRSGVIDSVHAFGASTLGDLFLGFIALTVAFSVGLIAWRWRALRPERPLEGLISREGAFLLGNILLALMACTVLAGTTFPIISRSFIGREITVGAPFYNRVVLPMAFVVVALMALGPALPFGRNVARHVGRTLFIPILLAIAATIAALLLGVRSGWTLACVAVTVLGTCAVVIDFARSTGARKRSTGEPYLLASLRLIDRDHRRYGGQLAHLGMMTISAGVVASGLFGRSAIQRFSLGQTHEFSGLSLTLEDFHESRGRNYSAVQAVVRVEGAGVSAALRPERRFYDTWADDPNSEVAISSDWRRDIYLTLAGWESGGEVVAIESRINPGVLWLWVGCAALVAGGLFGLAPRLLPGSRLAGVRASSARPAKSARFTPKPALAQALREAAP